MGRAGSFVATHCYMPRRSRMLTVLERVIAVISGDAGFAMVMHRYELRLAKPEIRSR